jgi:hypothetical protein
LLGADRIENSFSIVEVVYRAVAWQRVDQIHYIIELTPCLRWI